MQQKFIKGVFTSLLGLTVFVVPLTSQAIPLRELIFQTMDQEHPGVLTPAEIKRGRYQGYVFHRQYGDYCAQLDSLAKSSARRTFPKNASKQHEWNLECQIGFMMASESDLWNPAK
jgi:hypothetical protein